MMNTKQFLPVILCAGLLSLAISSRAQDIDIYTGLNASVTVPNIMVVVDNPGDSNAAVGTCTYSDGSIAPNNVPSGNNNGKAIGDDQCALVNLVKSMSKNADGSALLNLGITTLDGLNLPLTPVDDKTYTGPSSVTISGTTVSLTSILNRDAIIKVIKALSTVNKSGQGAELQETWAYYTGGNGTNGTTNTAIGSISGRKYPAPDLGFPKTDTTTGCQKNYIILLTSVKSSSKSQNNGESPYLDASVKNAFPTNTTDSKINISNAAKVNALDPSVGSTNYTGTIPNNPENPNACSSSGGGGCGIEWARFMFDDDINTALAADNKTSNGIQNIVTYAVATGDTGTGAPFEAYPQDVAKFGGGKYFAAGGDPAVLQDDIRKIFNEVQAVNSVFASSSLPVSANAQGTFLNQIFMGMFRPDANGNPRWLGNLKQYQLISSDPAASDLKLGDSAGVVALSSTTGFITPDAISFWTCTTPVCADPPNGFWANDPSTTLATAKGFDSPDGDRVERGGAAQHIRLINLNDDYTTTAGTTTNPRRLYTWCPTGFSCASHLSASGNLFTTANGALTTSLLGTPATVTITSTSDSSGTRTATASAADVTTIGTFGAAPVVKFANGNTCQVAFSSATTFDYPASGCGAAGGQTVSVGPTAQALINWVRGDDNVGDEASLCPPDSSGKNGTVNSGNCPGPAGNPAVTVRPSVHGDVLHSRPTVIDYGSYPITITSTSDSGGTRTATASAADVTTIGTFGPKPIVSFVDGKACEVKVTSATTFTYQSASCGPAGNHSAAVGAKLVVFYGDNGGVFHAVNGSQTATFAGAGPGEEVWGFVPKEFYGKLRRLLGNSLQVSFPTTPTGIFPKPQAKDYFIDGTAGLYQVVDNNGSTTKAVIYLSMRRGGNFIYALDVHDPTDPQVLWRVDSSSSGMGELGQTWSQPRVTVVRGYCGGNTCSSSNPPSPVLIFGAGYDTNEDADPPTIKDGGTTNQPGGRGIFVLDAMTGARVWSATPLSSGTVSSYSGNTASIAGMNYSIPSDITLVDRNFDGFIDRLYAADTGGNIWRVDLEPGGNATPDKWRVYQLAALGCDSGACGFPVSPAQRKFFYPPEVITATATHPYDSVIAGSGDREHPLSTTSTANLNSVFLLKDIYTGNDATGMTPVAITGSPGLFDASNNTAWDGTRGGYFSQLAPSEKVVNAPLAEGGFVFVGSNQPSAAATTSCNANLGIAKGYRLSPFDGKLTSVVFNGGGLPPSPVAGIVDINIGGVIQRVPFMIGGGGDPGCNTADCKSSLGGNKPVITPPTNRTRTYRYIEGK